MTTAKLALAAVAASIAFAGAYGFAASLGMSTGGFGANSKPVAACGSGITLGYTTASDPGASGYTVSGIDLSTIPAGCLRKNVSVTFLDGSGGAAGSAIDAVLPAAGTTQTISISPSSNPIDAAQVSGVSVVVS